MEADFLLFQLLLFYGIEETHICRRAFVSKIIVKREIRTKQFIVSGSPTCITLYDLPPFISLSLHLGWRSVSTAYAHLASLQLNDELYSFNKIMLFILFSTSRQYHVQRQRILQNNSTYFVSVRVLVHVSTIIHATISLIINLRR